MHPIDVIEDIAIGHGFELLQGTDGSGDVTTTLYTNTSDNNADPDKVSVDSGTPATSVVLPQTASGQVIKLFNNSDVVNPIMSFTLTSAMLWTSSGGGGGGINPLGNSSSSTRKHRSDAFW